MRRRLQVVLTVSALASGALAGPELAHAGPEEDLVAAQTSAAEAETQLAEATEAQSAAQAQLAEVAPKAAQANERAAAAAAEVQAIESEIAAERTEAAERIAGLESSYQDDLDSYDEERAGAIGLGLASLILAAIVLFWRQFRQSPPVEALADQSWPSATAIVVGAGIALMVAGGALAGSAEVAAGALGMMLVLLGLGLSVAFLLARHSLRVQRGTGQPLFTRRRLPRWIALVLAGLLLLFFVGGLADGVGKDEPEAPSISPEERALAEAAEDDPLDPPTDELVAAREAAEPVLLRADELESARQEAEAALAKATSDIRKLERDLAQAQGQIARASRQIARQQALAAPPPSSSSDSSSSDSSGSYSSCATAPSNIPVPPGSDLDADGDGIGCES